ncbi:MAG: polysaccharide biosynthesis C-terminal domain-containing protein, partial [Gemmatimonadales bacterium]
PAFFAAVQGDRAKLRRYLCSLTEGIALVSFPVCIGLAVTAGGFVRLALGPRWLPAILPLRLLAIYAAFRSVVALTSQVLIYTGHAKRNMQFSILAVVVLPATFLLGTHWGTAGVALGWVTVYPILIMTTFVRRALAVIEISWSEYLRSLRPAATATAVMALVVEALHLGLPHTLPLILRVGAQVLGGALTYWAIVWGRYRQRALGMLAMLRSNRGASAPPAPDIATAPRPRARRMILLTYHFPPDPAVGGLRWQKLARYAAERGWGIDVVAGDPGALPATDPGGLGDLPAGLRIYQVPRPRLRLPRIVDGLWHLVRPAIRGPAGTGAGRAQSLNTATLRWWPRSTRDVARTWFAWAEHRQDVALGRAAARVAQAVMEPGVHRVIVSCGPPHGVHVAARHLAGQADLPFVMDLRDPWRIVQRLPEAVASKAGLALARFQERRCVAAAALVIANTDAHGEVLRRLYPGAAPRIHVVPNGCDDDPLPARTFERRFVVAYAGNVYLDRDPAPFFRAVALVVREMGITQAEFGVEFMGIVDSHNGVPLGALAAAEGVGPFVQLHARGA